jgi:hypothetical protein
MSSPSARAKWAPDYGNQSPKRVAKGRERLEKRKETLGSPLPAPGSPLDKLAKAERRRKMVPNPLSSPHHTHESHKVEAMGSPLPKLRTELSDSVYYGPGLRESGWHLWDRSDGLSERRLLYRTFYNTKWGVAVELDTTSVGAFRYSISQFSKPTLVSRSGTQREIDMFCAPKLMHELRTQQRNGCVRMQKAQEYFGEWVRTPATNPCSVVVGRLGCGGTLTCYARIMHIRCASKMYLRAHPQVAEVRGMTILISQADGGGIEGRGERGKPGVAKREAGGVYEMIERAEALPQACEHGRQKYQCQHCGGKPLRPLQLLLHPDGFVFVGETMSPVSLAQSFQVRHSCKIFSVEICPLT